MVSISGRVLDLRSRGCGFEPHQRHCIVALSKTLYPLLSTGSTQEDPPRHNRKIVDWDVQDPHKQIVQGFPRVQRVLEMAQDFPAVSVSLNIVVSLLCYRLYTVNFRGELLALKGVLCLTVDSE